MKKIYQYPLTNMPSETIEIPVDSKLIKVAEQDKRITLWYEVDTSLNSIEKKDFVILMTGGVVPKNYTHLKTILMSYHGLVVHLYEKVK